MISSPAGNNHISSAPPPASVLSNPRWCSCKTLSSGRNKIYHASYHFCYFSMLSYANHSFFSTCLARYWHVSSSLPVYWSIVFRIFNIWLFKVVGSWLGTMRVFQMCVDGMYTVENLRWVSPAYHFFGKKKGPLFFLSESFIELSL